MITTKQGLQTSPNMNTQQGKANLSLLVLALTFTTFLSLLIGRLMMLRYLKEPKIPDVFFCILHFS